MPTDLHCHYRVDGHTPTISTVPVIYPDFRLTLLDTRHPSLPLFSFSEQPSFSVEMDTQTQTRRRKAVKQLYHRLQSCESWFLSPGDLQGLGIQALQVGITDDGILQFDPCFFQPYPERVLQKYPIDIVQMAANYPPETIPPLNFRLDFDYILRDFENDPGIKDPLDAARSRYKSTMEMCGPDEWEYHATDTYMHIRSQQQAARIGLPQYSSLCKLQSLKPRR